MNAGALLVTQLQTLFTFFSTFPTIVLFCSRMQFRILHCIQLSCLLSLLQSVTISQFFLAIQDLGSLEEYFVEYSLFFFSHVWCFLMIRFGLWFCRKKTTRVKDIVSGGIWHQQDLTQRVLNLVTWLKWCSPGFQNYHFPLIQTLFFGSESKYGQCFSNLSSHRNHWNTC